jgi:outer membrane protein assembly factor BamB
MPNDHIVRRTIAGWIAPFLLVHGLAAQTPSPPPPKTTLPIPLDWTFFLGPTGDSKSTETGIRIDWSNGGLPVRWSRQLGESYGIGAVYQGHYYQFDRHGDVAQLLCLDAETGAEHWRFEYPTEYRDMYGYNGGPRCSPIIDQDRIYLFGAEGMLHCVRTADGQLLWKVDTARQFGVVQNFFGVGSNPVIEGSLLIVMVGGSPRQSRQVPRGALDRVVGDNSGIVAFDKMTGRVVYQITDELASYASLKLATIQGRRWCFAFARGGLVGFEPSTGTVDFRYPWRASLLESVNASVPVVVDDQVFISEAYGPGSSLLKVRPGGYQVLWSDPPRSRQRAMQTHWNTAIFHDGYLYGSSGRHTHDAQLRCIDWRTGEIQWSEPGLTRGSLLYVDGHFVYLGEYGDLMLLRANPERFEQVSTIQPRGEDGQPLLRYPCWAAPILAHGRLYVRGRDRVVCFELVPQRDKRVGPAAQDKRLP